MDPDQTLKEARVIAERIIRHDQDEDAVALAERFQALDTWIARGGLPPIPWIADIDKLTRDILRSHPSNAHAYEWMNELRRRVLLSAITEDDL